MSEEKLSALSGGRKRGQISSLDPQDHCKNQCKLGSQFSKLLI
jgi:hypothetical protein